MKISGWRMPISGRRTERRWVLLIYFYFSLLRDISYVFRGCVSRIFVLLSLFFFSFNKFLNKLYDATWKAQTDDRAINVEAGFRSSNTEYRHRIPSRTWTRVPDYLWTLDNYNSRQEINKSRARRTHPVSLFHSHSRPAGRTPLSVPLSIFFLSSLSRFVFAGVSSAD